MSKDKFNDRINRLFERCAWNEARKLLERELQKDPDNHWLLTQLGVTYYEQRRYKKAMQLFLASRKIMDDCPLTLWNLAGVLDALGKHAVAKKILTWLLKSDRSPDEYPCWESKEWADALKADCVYSLAVCAERLGQKRKAEKLYRLQGAEGVPREARTVAGEIEKKRAPAPAAHP